MRSIHMARSDCSTVGVCTASNSSVREPPSDLAWYIAVSAWRRRRSGSGSAPSSAEAEMEMPMLALTFTEP